MTCEEWRQTQIWHDDLRVINEELIGLPGFSYADTSYIVCRDYDFHSLKDREYAKWDGTAKFNYDTMQDECTINWSETSYYSCTAELTRGLNDEDAFDAMQELLTLDNDDEKEEKHVGQPVIGEVSWT